MEECSIGSERSKLQCCTDETQHDVRSICEIRNQVYWVRMADMEDSSKE